MSGILEQMARVKPPTTANANDTAVSTTPSSATSMGTLTKDTCISFICTVAFNLEFGTSGSGTTDPSTNYYFAANTLYSFNPHPTAQSHFKVRATGAGSLKWWRSTHA